MILDAYFIKHLIASGQRDRTDGVFPIVGGNRNQALTVHCAPEWCTTCVRCFRDALVALVALAIISGPMILRRLTSLLTAAAVLHLSVVAGDAACATHGAGDHHSTSGNAMPMDGHSMPMVVLTGVAGTGFYNWKRYSPR